MDSFKYTEDKGNQNWNVPTEQMSTEMKKYFDGLPAYIQENIMQSGIAVESLEHLKRLARQYENGSSNG